VVPSGLYVLKTPLVLQDLAGIRLAASAAAPARRTSARGASSAAARVERPEAAGSVLLHMHRSRNIVIEGLGLSPAVRRPRPAARAPSRR